MQKNDIPPRFASGGMGFPPLGPPYLPWGPLSGHPTCPEGLWGGPRAGLVALGEVNPYLPSLRSEVYNKLILQL